MADPPPPPPPPHGQNPRPPGGLPDGNYDIFIIPPHSAGAGFLYLPSMQPHRNSFLAGVACTLCVIGVYILAEPVLKQWLALVMAGGGGLGVVVLVIAVGVGAWAFGKTQAESSSNARTGDRGGAGSSGSQYQGFRASEPPPNFQTPPPRPPPEPEPQPQPEFKARPNANADAWEKAREETRKREEERRRAEELKKKRDEAQRLREEAERAAKAKAEKEKWEQARAREKEQREREARERIAKERLAREKEAREKDVREREAREKVEKDKAAWERARQAEKEKNEKAKAEQGRSSPTKPATAPTTPSRNYEKPSARSQAGTEPYSFRPYDSPKAATYKSSASSISEVSESSYAPSQSTARTTPPPSHRGPYSTKDPNKVQIKAVYLFSDSFPNKPISQLVSNQGPVTDGLVLNIKTEGLFIDDDVRGVAQREWDVKAWTLKLVEDGGATSSSAGALHVLRATIRDAENKKYTFVLDESEAWKVAIGLGRLRKGSQVRSLGMSALKESEVKGLLNKLGWM